MCGKAKKSVKKADPKNDKQENEDLRRGPALRNSEGSAPDAE